MLACSIFVYLANSQLVTNCPTKLGVACLLNKEGGVAKGKRGGSAKQVMQELAPESYLREPNMTLENLGKIGWFMELWNLPLSGLSERVTAHVHIPKSRLQEMFLACSYTLCREMNFILWMQSTGNFFKCQIIFSCKQERWKWAASARSCVLSWEARSHQQITQVRSIFRGNTEYSLPPDMVQYTVKLLGLKISRTLKPIITRKSRYINYSIIWHVAFFQSLADAHSNLHR